MKKKFFLRGVHKNASERLVFSFEVKIKWQSGWGFLILFYARIEKAEVKKDKIQSAEFYFVFF